MASFVDLEDEDLIDADENDLYNALDEHGGEDGDNGQINDRDPDGILDGEDGQADAPDQAATDTSTKVAPKKRVVKNPQPKLNAERLKGPRGLTILEEWFKDMKFRGKRHEKEDLDAIMSRLEQWTNRLFPKFTYDDCLTRLEKLGNKKEVHNYIRRIRLDMESGFGGAAMADDEVEDADDPAPVQEVDPFDSLLNGEPRQTSTPAVTQTQTTTLTDEQRERIIRNRLLAEEKRLARAKERAEEQTKRQKEADEIAAAVAASQAMDEDFFPTLPSQNDVVASTGNGVDEQVVQRTNERERQQKEADEIAAALAASQALEDDFSMED